MEFIMKLASALDNYIRRSLISNYVPYLRKYSPKLYLAIKKIFEIALPISSINKLSRYQVRAIQNFISTTKINLANSVILEIGSDSEAKILREFSALGAKEAIGINPGLENDATGKENFNPLELPKNCRLQNDDASNLSFEDETFTHIFSVSVFEHLNNFDACLSEMYRVLKPGGIVYADFGPIWSSSLGHHVYAVADGEEARHWNPQKNPIPNHTHLLLDRDQMADLLREKVSYRLLEGILKWVYDQPYINRMFYEDYVRAFERSQFEIVHLSLDEEYINRTTEQKLLDKYPGYKKFGVRNAEIVLKKPE